MANENKPDTNHSQFFITLDATEYLNGKHTIFGKVVGNTLFNVLKMGDLKTDADDRPIYPPSIRSVTVVNNPFPDIMTRSISWLWWFINRESVREERQQEKVERAVRPKQVKNKNLLSFGGDSDEDEGFGFSVVSFQQANGIVKKEELKSEQPQKKEESEWVKKMKAKLAKKESQKRDLELQEKEEENKNATKEVKPELTTEEMVKEKVKDKIREMKKKSKEVLSELMVINRLRRN